MLESIVFKAEDSVQVTDAVSVLFNFFNFCIIPAQGASADFSLSLCEEELCSKQIMV